MRTDAEMIGRNRREAGQREGVRFGQLSEQRGARAVGRGGSEICLGRGGFVAGPAHIRRLHSRSYRDPTQQRGGGVDN